MYKNIYMFRIQIIKSGLKTYNINTENALSGYHCVKRCYIWNIQSGIYIIADVIGSSRFINKLNVILNEGFFTRPYCLSNNVDKN